jgi:F-type H+-transporting ATPase subunit b
MLLLEGNLLSPELGLIFWATVVFLLVFFLLKKLAWGPIVESLNERNQSIDDALQLAAKTRQEMAELKEGNQKMIAEAKAERDQLIKDAKVQADQMIADAKTAAADAAKAETDKARVAFDNEKNAAIAQIRKEAAALTLSMSEKVLRKELADKAAQETLVNDLLKEASLI